MANKMRAIHPGEILKGELEELHLSANALSKALNVPANRITAILSERRGITADTALRLARFLDESAEQLRCEGRAGGNGRRDREDCQAQGSCGCLSGCVDGLSRSGDRTKWHAGNPVACLSGNLRLLAP